MVLYFSGTGNSRFVASRIAEATGDALVDAAAYIRAGESAVFSAPGVYVFVSPVYVSAPPLDFLEFLRRSVFPADCRAYFVMTCAGGMGGAPGYCAALAAEKGFVYMGTAEVVMPQNYIALFKTKDAAHNRRIVEAALPVTDAISGRIRACRSLPEDGMKAWEPVATKMVLSLYYRRFMSAKPFAVSDRCVGCGQCAAVCPLHNIALRDGKPVWGERCTHCMACINLCPAEAVEYGRLTKGKPRYRGPEAALEARGQA